MSSKNKEKSYKEELIQTEGPLAEKDEVKKAEDRLRENTKKNHVSKTPLKNAQEE